MTEFIILIVTQILIGVGIVYYAFAKQTDMFGILSIAIWIVWSIPIDIAVY